MTRRTSTRRSSARRSSKRLSANSLGRSLNQIAQDEGDTAANEARRIREAEASIHRAWRQLAYDEGESAVTAHRIATMTGLPVAYVRDVCERVGHVLRANEGGKSRSQEMLDIVAREYGAGRVVNPSLLVGAEPTSGHGRWTWGVLQSSYEARGDIRDWSREFRRVAHTLHLEDPVKGEEKALKEYAEGLAQPFCACGRRWADCDGSRAKCRPRPLRRNGPDRYLLVRDLPRSLQAALQAVEYGRKDIEVKARETFDPSAAGGGGRRGFVAACKMDDSGTYEIEWGSWGGENPFTKTVEGYRGEVPIPPEVAFVRGSIGGGHPTNASVYVSPHAMNPALLVAGPEVTPKEAKILAIFKGIKSSYRPEYLDRLQEKEGIEGSRARQATTDREIDSLIERGFLSRNKAGSISITTEGRNAADPRQP